jgi:hypothetical protein
MIDFILKKVSEDSPHYNLTFMRLVHKRSGDVVQEPGDTIYSISLDWAKNRITHVETINRLGDKDISLNEYLLEFNKSYKEVCELLKTIL